MALTLTLTALGWLVLSLLALGVVACAGRSGREEDLHRGYLPAQDLPLSDRSCAGAPDWTGALAERPVLGARSGLSAA